MPYIEIGTPAYRRTLISMLLGSAVTFAVLYGPQTLIHVFSEDFGLPPSVASFAVSFATFALALSMVVVPVVSNAWGRKKIMGCSLFIVSMLNLLSAFSPNFELFLVIRVLQGIAMAGFPAIAMTYLSEEVSPAHLGRIMGAYISGTAVGGFAGRFIVSALTDLFTWQTAIFVLGLFSLTCSVLFWRFLPESNHFRPSPMSFADLTAGLASGLRDSRLIALYGCAFLLLGTYATLFNYIGFPLSQPPFALSQTLIGFLFIFQLSGSWSSYMFGKWTETHPRSRLMGWGVAMAVAGALLTLSGQLALIIVGVILFVCGFFAGHSLASGWVSSLAVPRYRAYASSLYLLFYYIGSSLVGSTGGLFLSEFGWAGVIGLICGLLVLTGGIVLLLSRAPQAREAGAPALQGRAARR